MSEIIYELKWFVIKIKGRKVGDFPIWIRKYPTLDQTTTKEV